MLKDNAIVEKISIKLAQNFFDGHLILATDERLKQLKEFEQVCLLKFKNFFFSFIDL